MNSEFNLGPGRLFLQDPDSREAQTAARAERIEALAEKLFVEWMGRSRGLSHPLDDGALAQVANCAAAARRIAAVFVDGGST